MRLVPAAERRTCSITDPRSDDEKLNTSSDALREVLRTTLKDTPKEAKLHNGSASSVRLSWEGS